MIYFLLTVLVSIDHRSHSSSGTNSPQLKICKCLSNKPFDVSALPPFNNSEADTRFVFFHIAYAAGQGSRPTMFELLIVISWSSPSPNSWTVRALVGLCSGGKTPRYSHPLYLPRYWTFQVSDILYHHMV